MADTKGYASGLAAKYSTDVGMSNEELNMRSVLTVMKKHEGGAGAKGYSTWSGGDQFTPGADHPGLSPKGKQAAGAFQIQLASWNDKWTGKALRTKYGIGDFKPMSQDKFSIATMKDKSNIKGSFGLITSGDFEGAFTTMSKEWRFLPGPDTQSTLKMPQLLDEVKTSRASELNGNSDIATPKGELLKGF